MKKEVFISDVRCEGKLVSTQQQQKNIANFVELFRWMFLLENLIRFDKVDFYSAVYNRRISDCLDHSFVGFFFFSSHSSV